MELELEYVSAGCNRIVNSLDWGACGLIAYAAHNSVFVYDDKVALLLFWKPSNWFEDYTDLTFLLMYRQLEWWLRYQGIHNE